MSCYSSDESISSDELSTCALLVFVHEFMLIKKNAYLAIYYAMTYRKNVKPFHMTFVFIFRFPLCFYPEKVDKGVLTEKFRLTPL